MATPHTREHPRRSLCWFRPRNTVHSYEATPRYPKQLSPSPNSSRPCNASGACCATPRLPSPRGTHRFVMCCHPPVQRDTGRPGNCPLCTQGETSTRVHPPPPPPVHRKLLFLPLSYDHHPFSHLQHLLPAIVCGPFVHRQHLLPPFPHRHNWLPSLIPPPLPSLIVQLRNLDLCSKTAHSRQSSPEVHPSSSSPACRSAVSFPRTSSNGT
mmetsp:Transcript_11427/g.28391  ORF Transcript_11427/g.28391 Transcript_11427/m.28391 type:complete len:211 (-) Transcript_11427:227-859(-)